MSTTHSEDGKIIQVVNCTEVPKSYLAVVGAATMDFSELGPAEWIVGGLAITGVASYSCYQTRCLQPLANFFSKSNNPPPGSDSSSNENEASTQQQEEEAPAKETSPNQMQKQVERGQAPKSVDRVDSPRFPNEKPHVEFKDGNALNNDGTWKHGGRELTNAEEQWLESNGWTMPKG